MDKKMLADQILNLASGLSEVDYDEATEQRLLDILKEAYNTVQAGYVTADVAWDKI